MTENPTPVTEPETGIPTPDAPKQSVVSSIFDFLEMFAVAVLIVMLLFTFVIRLCRVDGSSMENTLYDSDSLLLYSLGYKPVQDDIIVFHLTEPDKGLEKTLVKRVIATSGQTVEIHFSDREIYVDGVLYEDSHSVLKNYNDEIIDLYLLFAEHHYDASTTTFSATVPEGHIFVMGDNRNNSKDSRDSDIMFVDERCVLGKVILRFAPFTVFD